MPATESGFSATSDETARGFALAEFQLLQPLTEGPSPEQPSTYLPEKKNVGETLSPLSTGTTKINTKVPQSCFK